MASELRLGFADCFGSVAVVIPINGPPADQRGIAIAASLELLTR